MWKSSPTFIVLVQLTILGPYTLLTFMPGFGILPVYGLFRLAAEGATVLGLPVPDIATPVRIPLVQDVSLPQAGAVMGLMAGAWVLGHVWGKMPLYFMQASRQPLGRYLAGQGVVSVLCLVPCAVLLMAYAAQPAPLHLDMSLNGPYMGLFVPGDKLVLVMFLGAFHARFLAALTEQDTQTRLTRLKAFRGK